MHAHRRHHLLRTLSIAVMLSITASLQWGCSGQKKIDQVRMHQFAHEQTLDMLYASMLDNIVWEVRKIEHEKHVVVSGILKGENRTLTVYYEYTSSPPVVVHFELDATQYPVSKFASFLSHFFIRRSLAG